MQLQNNLMVSPKSMPISLDDDDTEANSYQLDQGSSSSTPDFPLILHQYWRPCSTNYTIGQYLDSVKFPISYRELVYRWIAVGKPTLKYFRTPFGIRNRSTIQSRVTSPLLSPKDNYKKEQEAIKNIQSLCEVQERLIVESIEDHFENDCASQSRLFVGFASHLDIYCALHAELTSIEQGFTDEGILIQIYERKWRQLLRAFEADRRTCVGNGKHDCLGFSIWGEVFYWPKDEIHRRFESYKYRSSAILESANSSLQGFDSYSRSPSQSPSLQISQSSENTIGGFNWGSYTSWWPKDDSRKITGDNSTPEHSTSLSQLSESSPQMPGTPCKIDERKIPLELSYFPELISEQSNPAIEEQDWNDALMFLLNLQDSKTVCDNNIDSESEARLSTNEKYHSRSKSQPISDDEINRKICFNAERKQSYSRVFPALPSLSNDLIQNFSTIMKESQQEFAFSCPSTPIFQTNYQALSGDSIESIRQKRQRESSTLDAATLQQLYKRLNQKF